MKSFRQYLSPRPSIVSVASAIVCGAVIGVALGFLGQLMAPGTPAPVWPEVWAGAEEPTRPSRAHRFVRKVMIGRQQEELDRAARQFYLRSNAERFAG